MKRADRIKEQLGMSIGMAAHKLRKIILFQLVQKLALDTCYRCSKKIETVEELSVEHKEHWYNESNAHEKFFDVDNNIAFSHFRCNSLHSRPRKAAVCGSISRYRNGCRCKACTNANRLKMKKYRGYGNLAELVQAPA